MPLLRVDGVSRRFGALDALTDVSLDVDEGEVLALIGPNGSGKTTLFNTISGIYPPTSGSVWFNAEPVNGLSPHRIARRGIARTFQNLRILERMSVFENVWLAQHCRAGMGLRDVLAIGGRRERGRRGEVDRLLTECGLIDRRESLAADLPLPDQRRLELARALAGAPRVLLLDEPAGGMTPVETSQMAALIRTVAAPGRALLVVEHKMDLVTDLCDRACVLDFGRKIAEGTPAEVLRDPKVLEVYVGAESDSA